MRGQGWRTLRQRTAVFRSMRRARARAGRQTSSRKAAASVVAMLARVGLK